MSKQTGGQTPEMGWEAVERMDWHLWLLATLLIFVLGASLVSFMFPSAFWLGEKLSVSGPQRAFFGFCLLLALVLVYLLQKQAAVRRLKRELYEAKAATVATERRAVIETFQTLPRRDQFRDTLAMEYRRASTGGGSLAVLLLTAPKASPEIMGRMTHRLRPLLRQRESLYRISNKALAVILPGMKVNEAASFGGQAEQLIGFSTGEMELAVTGYPDEAASLAELEGRLRGQER